MQPIRPSVSRKVMRSSPRRRSRAGSPSGSGSSLESIAGSQKRRKTSPIGVCGPVCVMSSLSSLESIRQQPFWQTVERRECVPKQLKSQEKDLEALRPVIFSPRGTINSSCVVDQLQPTGRFLRGFPSEYLRPDGGGGTLGSCDIRCARFAGTLSVLAYHDESEHLLRFG